jgi:hypothetical protein
MFWKDRNGRMHSTLNGTELLAVCDRLDQCSAKIDEIRSDMSATDDFRENTRLVAEKTGNLDLWKEMFGEEV